MNIEEPGRLVDFVASSLPFLSTRDKQDVLETYDVRSRLDKINQHLAKELEVQQLRNKIQSEVQDRVQQSQREYYLREQLKAIQKELGEKDDATRDIEEFKEKIDRRGMPEEVKKEAMKELNRLSRMSPMAADYSRHPELSRVACRASVGQIQRCRSRHHQGERDPRRGSLRSAEGQRPHPRLSLRASPESRR